MSRGSRWIWWLAAYAASVIAFGVGVGFSSLPGSNVLGALLLVGATLATWGVCFVVDDNNHPGRLTGRAASRWLPAPALGLVCLALIVSGLPASARFEASRTPLNEAAARAEAGETVSPGWIGLIPIDGVGVNRAPMGTVIEFSVASSGDDSGECTLAHAGPETTRDWTGIGSLGGDWWLSCPSPDADMP